MRRPQIMIEAGNRQQHRGEAGEMHMERPAPLTADGEQQALAAAGSRGSPTH
jgi:hypothetical protein